MVKRLMIFLFAVSMMLGEACSADDCATASLRNALAGVRARYRAKLERYDLTESYFDETAGVCDLMLLDVDAWTKFQIVYYRSNDNITCPVTMPMRVAKDLMGDRLIIHTYETVLAAEDKRRNAKQEYSAKPNPPAKVVKPTVKPEDDLPWSYQDEPDLDEKFADLKAWGDKAKSEMEKRSKGLTVSERGDIKEIASLKKSGMSDREIIQMFGKERVRQYNAMYPNKPVKVK